MADQCQVCGATAKRGQLITFSTLVEADPSAVNGSPETVVAAAVSSAADLIAPWLDALLDAASTSTGSSLVIEGRLWTTAQQLDLAPLVEHVFEQLMRGSMLGGLDAHWEGEHGETILPAQFAGSAIGPAGGIKDFTTKPFRQAIDDFQSRNVVTRPVFDALNAEAKLKAFTVAGLLRDDILNTAHSELLNAVTAGSDLREFRKSLNARFESAGYTSLAPSHIETVFRTNVMTAYGAGRTEQMRQPHVIAARPYWQITGPNDGVAPAGRSRPAHFAARGKVLRVDDPFWQNSGAPPWGYNCRCRVISRSQADVDRLGLNLSTGSELADLPDKGFESRRLPPPPAPSAAPPAPSPTPKHDPRVPVQSVGPALRPFKVAPEKAHILKTTVGTGANQDMVAKLYSDAPTTVVKALEKAPLKDFEGRCSLF